MIAAIEHQRIGRRKTSLVQHRTLPAVRPKRSLRLQPVNPTRSWRRIQKVRRPKAVGAKQRQAKAVALVKARGAGRRALLGALTRTDLILIGFLAAAALVPLAFGFSSLTPSSRVEIRLPAGEDAESVLFHFLIPEEQGAVGETSLGADIIDSISTTRYTVRSGDTISAIAQRFNLSMDTVISFNNIQDARALETGTVLTLPNANGLKHNVKRGDYLGGIAKKYGVALNHLLDWNNLETSVIVPGQELFIPGARMSEMDLNRVFGRLFIYPTQGRITDRFGTRRDPFSGIARFHNGVDLAGQVGTPVIASMSGKVAMVGYNPAFGKYIIITHPEGFQTLYGHLDAFRVKRGESVKQGQLIGDMGNSGYSTGSHLHFSIFRRGEPIDPSLYLH